ncbi:MAG: ABC transporter ATP-binding protein [Bacilli bacterium]
MIHIENLEKRYLQADEERVVLRIPHIHIESGEQVAIVGKSGSGKSTLLHIIGGLLTFEGGTVVVDEQQIETMKQTERDRFRRERIGFVFQEFHLIPSLTAHDNVRLGLHGVATAEDEQWIDELFTALDITMCKRKRPNKLSRGQKQRVAIARALVHRPALLLADEPTGSLDPETAEETMHLMKRLATEAGTTFICVTHDLDAAEQFARVIRMEEIMVRNEKGDDEG